jgi:hypothetical protein
MHQRTVAADKWLVCIVFRPCSVPSTAMVVEKMGGNQRFRLASIRRRTAFLRRRSCCFDGVASHLVRTASTKASLAGCS